MLTQSLYFRFETEISNTDKKGSRCMWPKVNKVLTASDSKRYIYLCKGGQNGKLPYIVACYMYCTLTLIDVWEERERMNDEAITLACYMYCT